jgi:hypothetical protein
MFKGRCQGECKTHDLRNSRARSSATGGRANWGGVFMHSKVCEFEQSGAAIASDREQCEVGRPHMSPRDDDKAMCVQAQHRCARCCPAAATQLLRAANQTRKRPRNRQHIIKPATHQTQHRITLIWRSRWWQVSGKCTGRSPQASWSGISTNSTARHVPPAAAKGSWNPPLSWQQPREVHQPLVSSDVSPLSCSRLPRICSQPSQMSSSAFSTSQIPKSCASCRPAR